MKPVVLVSELPEEQPTEAKSSPTMIGEFLFVHQMIDFSPVCAYATAVYRKRYSGFSAITW